MDHPALTEVTDGLMFEFSKVRSALETRKYIILVGLESFIDKSDHRFMWCGASVLSVAAVSQFGP
jgi:hypothetical protein